MLRATLLIACVTIALAVFSPASAARDASDAAASNSPVADDAIEKLIAELGSAQFAVRRRAEDALMRLGPDAVDALKVAEDNPDLEISERVRYIQQRLRVDWTQPDDPDAVRRLLARYGDLSQAEKEDRIEQLAKLPAGEGFGALCRIARLEPSLVTARRAALALMDEPAPQEGPYTAAESYERELGSSTRAPVEWVRLHLREAKDPRAAAPAWQKAVEVERALLKQKSSETDQLVTIDLLVWRIKRCNELNLLDETAAALVQTIEFSVDRDPTRVVESLEWALQWIIDNKRWEIFDRLKPSYEEDLNGNRILLYMAGTAAARSAHDAEAQALAKQAFELEKRDEGERLRIAYRLAHQYGMVDWAIREYRRSIAKLAKLGAQSAWAHSELATWLHDRQEYEEAAKLLAEFCDGLEADAAGKEQLARELESDQIVAELVTLPELDADRHYYQAFHYESLKEYEKQRASLEKAIQASPSNPDILIAMYRSPGANEAFRQRTLERIRKMSKAMLAQVAEDPDNSGLYNQWAWLISNTEGDYAEALKFSQRSLELRPDEPGLLDTLGRCYFAAGDLENAVKSQRRAVELAPHFGVMQRQLKLFEEALAAKQGGE